MVRTDAETQLVVRLLGDPEVRWGATPIKAFDSPRLRSLLAFLIVGRERAISRQRLAFEFWPDSTEGQARTNLRQALHHIRHALADADRYLRVDSRSVQWLADSPAVIDLIEFEAAARAGLRSGDEYLLVRAADDYRGDLLAGCYDEWLGPERDRLQALAGSVLRALGELAHGRGQWARAADVAERLLRLDPLDEAAHRLLIDAHASAGDRVRALRRYHECAAVLARELGVAPAADTMALHDALIAGDRRAEPCESVEPTADHAPLVGRYEELQVLIDAWDDIIRGRPHLVLVTGEPGIGKTRLVEELIAICRRESDLTAVARAYEAEGALPYGPVIDVLRTEAMQGSVDALDADGRRELARVLPELSSDAPDHDPNPHREHRRRLFDVIGRVLLVPPRRLVLAIDDLHWCDPDTFELLEFVLRKATSTNGALLLVGTVREDELASRPTLRAGVARLHAATAAADRINLRRLDASDARELVNQVVGSTTSAAVERLISAADGNPLFLVEMARGGMFRRSTGPMSLELPPRVQAVIDTRLDRLSDATRSLVAVAAVVGRSFTIDLIARLVNDEQTAITAVDELWRRGIVRERGVDSYDFSHDRIRDVAYQRIGPARRRAHHAAVARALEELGDAEPGQVAYHLERAGQVDAAIAAYRRAVDAAVRAFAHQDVISNCRRALGLVEARARGPDRDEAELAFLIPLGVALMAGPGISDTDLDVYRRARTLRSQRGLAADPSTLRISANAAIGRREYVTARRFGETLLQRGLDERDVVLITEGHYLIGVTSFWLGDLHTSRRSLQLALESHQARHTAVHLERFGQDPRAVCLVRLGLTSFQLADEATAAESCARALERAAELGHEYTDVYVRMFAAWYLSDSGQADAAADVVNGMPATTQNPVAPIARAQFSGWAHTQRGDAVTGVRLLCQAQHAAHHHGPLMFEPYALMLLARSRLAAGEPSAAHRDATSALGIATSEMPYHVPEASRLVAEIEMQTDADAGRALDRLELAADAAAGSGAVIHELRARTSLLRAARLHAPASVAQHARTLQACCDALPPASDLCDLAAARRELAGGR